MIEDQYTLPDGTWVERTTFAWTDLKYFLLWTAIIAIIVVITTVIVVAHFYAKKKVSKTITSTSEMIHTYMNGSKEATEVFPKQYSEIFSLILFFSPFCYRTKIDIKNSNYFL